MNATTRVVQHNNEETAPNAKNGMVFNTKHFAYGFIRSPIYLWRWFCLARPLQVVLIILSPIFSIVGPILWLKGLKAQ